MKPRGPGDAAHQCAVGLRIPRLCLAVLVLKTNLAFSEFQPRRLRIETIGGPSSLLSGSRESNSEVVLVENAETGAAAGLADELLHFLGRGFANYEEFLPACLSHTKKVVQVVTVSYTFEQLPVVLEHECSLDAQFAHIETGFDNKTACIEFAGNLVDARKKELDTGSDTGYEVFCKTYYLRKGGVITTTISTTTASTAQPEAKEENATGGSVAADDAGEAHSEASKQRIYDREFKRQKKLGKSDEEAKTKAENKVKRLTKKAKDKQFEINYDDTREGDYGHFPVWAVVVVLGGVVAFVFAGFLASRCRKT